MATPSRHYRLNQADLDNIARLRGWVYEDTGTEPTDSDVIRYALLQTAKRLGLLPKTGARKNICKGA